MELYLIKSASILGILFLFYKIALENTSLHHFKRYYLVGSVLLAFIIPLITFTMYVEVPATVQTTYDPSVVFTETTTATQVNPEETKNYLPLILWFIYGIGVVLFLFRFCKNLWHFAKKIKRSETIKKERILYSLLKEKVIPHTFLNYIFFEKETFTSGKIPKEIMLHEQTHAKELHSLDLILLELMQVVFWFNPLFYFLKKSSKLNHEFLADNAVLNNGVSASLYQQLLLSFSSPERTPPLANSINYASFKKRFTLMKTQTSKRTTLGLGIVLVCLSSLLIYGFSQKEETFINSSKTAINETNGTLNITISENEELTFNGKKVDVANISEKLYGKTYDNVSIVASPKVSIPFGKKLITTIRDLKISSTFCYSVQEDTESLDENYLQHLYSFDSIDGLKTFALTIKDDLIFLNGEEVTLNEFKAEINDITKSWSLEEYTNSNPNILVTETTLQFLKQANSEFIKTEISRNKNKLVLNQFVSNKKGFNTNVTSQEQYALNYLEGAKRNGKKAFVLQIKQSKLIFNNKEVSLSAFANTVDEYTKNWTKADYKEAHPSVLISSTPKAYLDKVDAEFRKTKFSKANGGINIVPPPPPAPPKVKKGERSNIPPPPPAPTPPVMSTDPLDNVIRLAKEYAAFMYEDQPVTSDEAIALVKENRKLFILVRRFEKSNPIVDITHEEMIFIENANNWKAPNDLSPTKSPMKDPASVLDTYIKQNALFFIDKKPVTAQEAQKLLREDRPSNLKIKKNKEGRVTVHIQGC